MPRRPFSFEQQGLCPHSSGIFKASDKRYRRPLSCRQIHPSFCDSTWSGSCAISGFSTPSNYRSSLLNWCWVIMRSVLSATQYCYAHTTMQYAHFRERHKCIAWVAAPQLPFLSLLACDVQNEAIVETPSLFKGNFTSQRSGIEWRNVYFQLCWLSGIVNKIY